VLFVGSKGKLLHDTYGVNPRLLPASLHESVGVAPDEPASGFQAQHHYAVRIDGRLDAIPRHGTVGV
jgi:hypothetical protein